MRFVLSNVLLNIIGVFGNYLEHIMRPLVLLDRPWLFNPVHFHPDELVRLKLLEIIQRLLVKRSG